MSGPADSLPPGAPGSPPPLVGHAPIRTGSASAPRDGGRLSLRGLSLALRSHSLAVDLDCAEWPLVILGPSGAGKTVLLRLIAGLQRPDKGEIEFDGQRWAGREAAGSSRKAREIFVPAHRRPIGYCRQEPFLFPHLSALENVCFPLRSRSPRIAPDEAVEMAREELRRWRVGDLERARVEELSGGERGRVALARATVGTPRLLLLDEPFASLDPPLQEKLLAEAMPVIGRAGSAAIWVTHDRTEAMLLGGTLAVLWRGEVAQAGRAEEIFRCPVNQEIADFLGTGSILHGVVQARESGVMRLVCGSLQMRAAGSLPPGTPVVASVRSEEVEISLAPAERGSARNELPAVIVSVRPLGLRVLVELDAGARLLASITRPAAEEMGLRPGLRVTARIKALGVQVRSEDWRRV